MRSATTWCVLGGGVLTAAVFLVAAEKRDPKQPATAGPPAGVTDLPPRAGQPGDPPRKPTVEELRKKYPFESVADRLDYEPAGAQAFAKSEPAPKTTDATLKRLADQDQSMENMQKMSMRVQSLKLLHSSAAQKFIDRDGFGLSRMPTPSYMLLDLPAAPTIPFASVRDAAGDKKAPAPKEDVLANFHRQGLFDFLNPNAFGFVQDREHVAGFVPHEFRRMPNFPASDKAPSGRMEQWAVVHLELVSLLKHDKPAVYVTDALPRMMDAVGAPTRPLTAFEDKSLKALKEGDDLATESTGDRIRMVGSLRAGKQCLDCHEVHRGDLLGAFSWELQRQTVAENKLP